MEMEAPDSRSEAAVSGRSFFPPIAAAVVILFFIFFVPYGSFGEVGLFIVVLLSIIALWDRLSRYRRLILLVIVPGLFAFDVTAWILYSIMNSGAGVMKVSIIRFLAGGPGSRLLWAIVLGVAAGVLVPWLILQTYILYNKDTVMAFTGLDETTTRRALRGLFLNMTRASMIVANGKEGQTKPQGVLPKLGGPGLVIIQPGNAVIFERGGKITNVVLHGTYPTARFERIRKIINLTNRAYLSSAITETGSRKKLDWTAPRIRTRDNIELNIDLQVYYRIRRQSDSVEEESDQGPIEYGADRASDGFKPAANPYHVTKRDVMNAAFHSNDWETVVPEIAVDHLRDVVANYNLEELFEGNPAGSPKIRGDVCDEVRRRTQQNVNNLGVEVAVVVIGEVEMPEDVQRTLQQHWQTNRKMEIAQTESRAKGIMLSALIENLTRPGGLSPEQAKEFIERLESMDVVRVIARDPSSKLLIPYDFPTKNLGIAKDLTEATEGNGAADYRGITPGNPTPSV